MLIMTIGKYTYDKSYAGTDPMSCSVIDDSIDGGVYRTIWYCLTDEYGVDSIFKCNSSLYTYFKLWKRDGVNGTVYKIHSDR